MYRIVVLESERPAYFKQAGRIHVLTPSRKTRVAQNAKKASLAAAKKRTAERRARESKMKRTKRK